MKNTRLLSLYAIILLCSLMSVHATDGHITLLTVSEGDGIGGTADLYLTVKPGTGSIFIDSFPLTKVDTQSSVRYANQIACDMLQKDCSQYDFFYTIRANSAIVGGPSAGGAMAVLTVAVLDNQHINQKLAMTGTINSGGIIGPIAGVSEKVQGARVAGITTVLIPALTTTKDLQRNMSEIEADNDASNNATNSTNVTRKPEPLQIGRVEQLSDSRFTVTRVGTIEDALLIATGKDYRRKTAPLIIPEEYTRRMRRISKEICDRTTMLERTVTNDGTTYNDTHNYTARINSLNGLAQHAYSQASLCFSKNIELATLHIDKLNAEQHIALRASLRVDAAALENTTRNTRITTISDLETYAIVMERIVEAQQLLDENSTGSLAYAQERLLSAKIWSEFFGISGPALRLDQEYLQHACLARISEADERINYVRLYAPRIVDESQSLLDDARKYSGHEPILCIFTASKAKAQADLLSTALSIGDENIDALIEQKLAADEAVLAKQQEKGFFPVLGYSYAQYAHDLREQTPYSALTFAEYAIELSSLDMYFPKEKGWHVPLVLRQYGIVFLLGALFGTGTGIFLMRHATVPKKRKKR